MDHLSDEVTGLLRDLQDKKLEAAPRLFELLYNELRGLAKRLQ